MKQSLFEIIENRPLTDSVMLMRLRGDTSDITGPGQFVNVKLDGLFLRRPISVCDCQGDVLTLIYKVVGKGTEAMKAMTGGKLDILTGLGNGFSTDNSATRPLLVGGGVGVPPMYNLCKRLLAEGKQPRVVLGFNTASELFFAEEFKALGVDVYCSTADGSVGTKGFVTDAIRENGIEFDYLYTCGPLTMLKALYDSCDTPAEFSFEERMGCGFGACMGCSCKTKYGYKRICKDGPVLKREEIIW